MLRQTIVLQFQTWTILQFVMSYHELIGHRTKLKTKKVNFFVFQKFNLNFAVFLSVYKTYILLNFIECYKRFLRRNHTFYHYAKWKIEQFFKSSPPPPPPRYRYSRLAWLNIHKRSWHNKWRPVSRGKQCHTRLLVLGERGMKVTRY